MLKLNDGRSELWQWDTGRKLTVDADCSQVHFSNKIFGRSIDVDVVDGVASIPDILLQTDKDLNAWAFVGTAENGYTKISKIFKVNKRNKPAGYVFTPTEQTTLGELVERLEKIEETQDPDVIKNAVDDYLASNPIQVEETDPTVPDWAKKPTKPSYTAEEVGALPSDTVIPIVPEALPNPYPMTFTGAVEATYDGSEPVEVVIPQGGGGSADWQLLDEIDLSSGALVYEWTGLNCSDIIVVNMTAISATSYITQINDIEITKWVTEQGVATYATVLSGGAVFVSKPRGSTSTDKIATNTILETGIEKIEKLSITFATVTSGTIRVYVR